MHPTLLKWPRPDVPIADIFSRARKAGGRGDCRAGAGSFAAQGGRVSAKTAPASWRPRTSVNSGSLFWGRVQVWGSECRALGCDGNAWFSVLGPFRLRWHRGLWDSPVPGALSRLWITGCGARVTPGLPAAAPHLRRGPACRRTPGGPSLLQGPKSWISSHPLAFSLSPKRPPNWTPAREIFPEGQGGGGERSCSS